MVVSDAHERRLGEAADALAALPESGRCPPLAVPCNVTDEGQVQGLYDAAVARARAVRRGGQQRRTGRAGRRGRHDRRAVGPGPRRHPHRDLPLHPGRAPPLLLARRRRGDRQQRLGARVAGPGRPVPLRGGQGGCDGPHPVLGGRGGAPRGAGQRGVARAWPSTRSSTR